MEAVRAREAELFEAWRRREEVVRKGLEERVVGRDNEIKFEVERLEAESEELQNGVKTMNGERKCVFTTGLRTMTHFSTTRTKREGASTEIQASSRSTL